MAAAAVPDQPESEAAAVVRNMAGRLLAEVRPVPPTVQELKVAIEASTGCAAGLQRLVSAADASVFADGDALPAEGVEILMVVDETPMFTWDLAGNPAREYLEVDGSVVKCPEIRSDFINVLTKEPIRRGIHYYQFVMHCIGDEQWCGVTWDPTQAGPRVSGRYLKGCFYYCGRMRSSSTSIVDGQGALHTAGRAVKQFDKVKPSGDIIGMLVDLERRAVAFDLNGKLQGACPLAEPGPLWVQTHVDTSEDHVELRKPCLDDAPPSNLEALQGALLDVTQGVETSRGYGYWAAPDPGPLVGEDEASDCDAGAEEEAVVAEGADQSA